MSSTKKWILNGAITLSVCTCSLLFCGKASAAKSQKALKPKILTHDQMFNVWKTNYRNWGNRPLIITFQGRKYELGLISSKPDSGLSRVKLTDVVSQKEVILYKDVRYGRDYHSNNLHWLIGEKDTPQTGRCRNLNFHQVTGPAGKKCTVEDLIGSEKWKPVGKKAVLFTIQDLGFLFWSLRKQLDPNREGYEKHEYAPLTD